MMATMIGIYLLFAVIFAKAPNKTAGYQLSPTPWVTSGTNQVPVYRPDREEEVTLVGVNAILDGTVLKPTFLFVNASQKPINACGFVLEAYSAHGQILRKLFTIDSALLPGQSPIQPSNKITVNFIDAELADVPVRIEITVDHVEFADGSVSGKDTGGFHNRISAERRGATRAIQYLREQYLTHGAGALEKILGVKKSNP
jgi:hypothetical protein